MVLHSYSIGRLPSAGREIARHCHCLVSARHKYCEIFADNHVIQHALAPGEVGGYPSHLRVYVHICIYMMMTNDTSRYTNDYQDARAERD